jgi:hypothetical protein
MGSEAGAGRWLRLLAVFAPAALAAAILFAGPPLPQSASYHAFADRRTLLGIPHCLNILSNFPFLVVGVLGLHAALRRDAAGDGRPFRTRGEAVPYALFFLDVALTAFGSSHYHLDPTNDRLTWDRLPMALAFTALFAAVLGDRLGPGVGRAALVLLVLVGVGSVLYWHWTEQQGRGDLRPYFVVQFGPALALPLLLLLFPPRYTGSRYLWLALLWYVLAKVFEHPLEHAIFSLGHVVSGHTLKHLAAAGSAYCVLRMVQCRRPCPGGAKEIQP